MCRQNTRGPTVDGVVGRPINDVDLATLYDGGRSVHTPPPQLPGNRKRRIELEFRFSLGFFFNSSTIPPVKFCIVIYTLLLFVSTGCERMTDRSLPRKLNRQHCRPVLLFLVHSLLSFSVKVTAAFRFP